MVNREKKRVSSGEQIERAREGREISGEQREISGEQRDQW